MIKEEHFQFKSGHGSIQCHGMRWIPDGKVQAVLQIAHGMSEHIERYRAFGMYMAARGVLVVGHDHLGHGGSVLSEKDYGYFEKDNGNRILLADMHRVQLLTRKKYKKIPYILLGHSMGSFLARQYACVYGSELDGLIVCGTGYQPYAVARFGMLLARLEASLYGWEHRSGLLWWMTFGSYNAKFRPNRTSCDWLCRDGRVVDAYISDPRCGFAFTLNGYYNLLLGLSKIARRSYRRNMPKNIPVLLISGEADPVGCFGKGVRRVEKQFRAEGVQQVECRLYPDDRHELLNELDKEQVYADIVGWMERSGLALAEKG